MSGPPSEYGGTLGDVMLALRILGWAVGIGAACLVGYIVWVFVAIYCNRRG